MIFYPLITKLTNLLGTTISFTNSLFPSHLADAIFAVAKISSFVASGDTSISHLFLPFTVTAKTIDSKAKTSSLISIFPYNIMQRSEKKKRLYLSQLNPSHKYI